MKSLSALDFLKEATSLNVAENCKQLDISLMICSLLNLDKVNLYTNPPLINSQQRDLLFSMISRRNRGEPLAYILGTKGFWNLELDIDDHVLVPRPETETLIKAVLEEIGEEPKKVLDVGTGSGAIALVLAKERKQWHIFANDKYKEALQTAKRNQLKLELEVSFLRSHWLDSFGEETLDIIISNPPYIEENDQRLTADGIKYEPLSSLVSRGGGMKDLKEIMSGSSKVLKKGGYLFLEHAPWQANKVKNFLLKSNFKNVKVFDDLNGDKRTSLASKPL